MVGVFCYNCFMKTFLEIGSCDFDTLEYLADLGWKGVMIEPIPKYYNRLRGGNPRSNIHYLNVAVDWTEGERVMYMASKEKVSEIGYTSGMSSFFPNPDVFSEEVIVKTLTIDRIFEICEIQHVDFLKIDTEGYDAEIVKMFPFERCKPDFVKVEKEHLSHKDLNDTISRLSSNGYHCEWTERDIFAFRVM